MSQGKLTNEQKTYVVQSLACFDTPHEILKVIKEEFGVVVSAQAIEAYDPTKRAGRDLAKKWREIFEATRKAFLADTSTIGISHRAVRLRALQRMAEQAESMRNFVLAKDLLEQAAKEVGGAYTNRRELSGPQGKPIQTQNVTKTEAELIEQAQRLGIDPAALGLGGEETEGN